MLNSYISEVCSILNIPAPSISFDISNFTSETMMAQIDSEGKTIYIRKFDNPHPDQFFAIAHELRHKWQMQTAKDRYFSDYLPRERFSSAEEYNLQPAELDANAFAGIIMEEFFNLKPLFQGLSNKIKARIYNRMEHIIATELSE